MKIILFENNFIYINVFNSKKNNNKKENKRINKRIGNEKQIKRRNKKTQIIIICDKFRYGKF